MKLLGLPTHFTFGFAIGPVFFGHSEIALLISLGALLPDLVGNTGSLQKEYMQMNKFTELDYIMYS